MKRTNRKRRDRALETAREILEHWICECGDTRFDHERLAGRGAREQPTAGKCMLRDCRCKRFVAVRFTVERRPPPLQ